MSVYRHNLDLRVVFCRVPDKAALLRERFAPPADGILAIAAADAPAALGLARDLAARDWPARALLPDREAANRRTLAWSRSAHTAVLVFPRRLFVDSGRAWRGLRLLDWPPDPAELPRLWAPVGRDGLEASVDVLAARADLDVHARALAEGGGRLRLVRFLRTPESLFSAFDPRRALFLRRVFEDIDPPDAAGGPRVWDIEAALRRTGAEPERLEQTLAYLAGAGWIALADPAAPGVEAPEGLRRRREALRSMAAWLEGGECRWRGLRRRLGEPEGLDCGHCDQCRGKPPGLLP